MLATQVTSTQVATNTLVANTQVASTQVAVKQIDSRHHQVTDFMFCTQDIVAAKLFGV